MSERAAPFHCPYCGDEDLRPSEDDGHGSWGCMSCSRAFQLKFLGLLRPEQALTRGLSADSRDGGVS